MKKYFFLAAFAIGVMSLTSCKKNCCSLLTAKICEDDMPSSYTSWDDYKASLESAGYNCD